MIRKQLFIYLLLVASLPVSAQFETLSGCILDANNKTTVPMVNVYLKGTTIGTITDSLGYFNIRAREYTDTIVFSSVGYHTKMMRVSKLKSPCEIFLEPNEINLGEVAVKPDDSWVRYLLKSMVDNKPQNNPDKHPRYHYEKYTKWEYHLSNVDSALMLSPPFAKHRHLFKTSFNGSRYLPVYLSEQIVKNEFQNNPLKQKSTIIADNTNGLGVLGDYEVGGYTAGLDMQYNFYNNFIKVFEESFVSPAADNGWFYYRYYLVDSVMHDTHKEYTILFVPKRKHDKVFRGHLILEDKNFSIVNVEAALSSKTNLNFLKEMQLNVSYHLVNDRDPFYQDQKVYATFDYLPFELPGQKRRMELEFNQFSSFSKVELNPREEVMLSARNLSYESIKLDGSYNRDSTYWKQARHVPLSAQELEISASIDSINDISIIKVMDNTARMMMTGFYDVGKVELGPYMNFLQFNKIEGVRMFAGGRTSKEISDRWMLWGGVGYGIRTEKLSGSLGGGYRLKSPKRRMFELFYDDRYIRMGENRKILYLYENMLSPSENNLISAFFVRDEFDELHRQKNVNFTYRHEWKTGLSSIFNVGWKKQYSPEYYPFIYNGSKVDYINAYEAAVDIRFSFKEKIIDDEFMRLYLSSNYPIIHFTVGAGRAEFADQELFYTKLHTTLKHQVNIGQTWFRYAVEGGMIFGKVPFTLLEIPRGNETYGYYLYDFNLLNYLEFAHDKYAHLYMDYHLNGFVFNRLPLFRSLGLREVLSAKAMVGSLSDKQYETIDIPPMVTSLEGPYLEVGAGLENILRLIRIEGIWRVTPSSIVGAPTFGIRAKISLNL